MEDVSFNDNNFDLNQLQFEFLSLYQIFNSNKDYCETNIDIVFLADYLCDLIYSYYQTNGNNSQLPKLKKQKKVLAEFIEQHGLQNELHLLLLKNRTIDRQKYNDFFIHIFKIHQYVGQINTNRTQFNYSRNLATTVLNYLQKSSFFYCIQKLQELLGNQFAFTEGINFLNESREALAILGITLFSLRLLINLIILIKQIIEAAIREELSVKNVLKQELKERGFIMVSDFVWATVTLLTTYNNLFHISSLAIPPIILIFLVFDAVLLLSQWFDESIGYDKQLQQLIEQKKEATSASQIVIQRQIDILNDQWQATSSYYAINILGASILACGYALTLLCSGPLILAGLAMISMLGNALYNTSNQYKKYRETKIALQREQLNGMILNDEYHQSLIQILNNECHQQQKEFWITLGCNIGGMAFIISAAVISWPIALCLTAGYIAYQLIHTYQNYRKQNIDELPHDVYRILHIPSTEDLSSEELTLTDTPMCFA